MAVQHGGACSQQFFGGLFLARAKKMLKKCFEKKTNWQYQVQFEFCYTCTVHVVRALP
jgi:hypothetical protein